MTRFRNIVKRAVIGLAQLSAAGSGVALDGHDDTDTDHHRQHR